MQCVEEVRYNTYDYLSSGFVPAIDGGVVKSDGSVTPQAKRTLQHATALLKRTVHKHLNDDNVVLHVVDPYLFSFVWDRTRTLRSRDLSLSDCISRCGEGRPVKAPSQQECAETDRAKYPNEMAWSRRFQFLPFDAKFGNRGTGSCQIASYIPNVHPVTQQPFYSILEKFVDATLPLFNQTLIDLKAPGYTNQRFHVAVLGREPMIFKEPGDFLPPEERTTRQWLDSDGRFQDFIFVDLKREFWNIGLQFIPHVFEIKLSPNTSTSYPGEPWHIQGRCNERICASAMYMYGSHNISQSPAPKISFRRRIHAEEAALAKGYIQTPPFAPELYGAKSGDPVIQHMGNVQLREGRVITWPNIFQTKINKVELEDPSREGYLKILVLHLVDPNRRMMSTSLVPPQRRDWWADEIRAKNARFWRLPREVWDLIVGMVDDDSDEGNGMEKEWPIGMQEAERTRSEFWEENEEARRRHTKAMEDYLEWDLDWEDEE